jgi:hypothetical protein
VEIPFEDADSDFMSRFGGRVERERRTIEGFEDEGLEMPRKEVEQEEQLVPRKEEDVVEVGSLWTTCIYSCINIYSNKFHS